MNATTKNIVMYVGFILLFIVTYYILTSVENYDRSLNPKLDEIKDMTIKVHPGITNIELYDTLLFEVFFKLGIRLT